MKCFKKYKMFSIAQITNHIQAILPVSFKYGRTPLIRRLVIRITNFRRLVIRIANYPEAGYSDRQLSGGWLSGSPIIRRLVIRIANYPEAGYPDRQLSGTAWPFR
jgi:hypothetical protein